MPSEEERYRYSYIADLIAEDMEAISAFRAYFILEYNDGILSEKDRIPFITTPVYPVLLVGYLLLKRVTGFFRRALTRDQPRLNGHVLMVSSTATYRFRPFLLIGRALPNPVTLLCTKSTKEKLRRESQFGDSYNVVSHNDLHELVSVSSVVRTLLNAWQINRQVADRLEVETLRSRWIGYNLVFTELIKSESFSAGKSDLASFHTQSPSPYGLKNVDDDHLFLYQHGQTISMTDRVAAADCNLTYFTWGPGWRPERHCSQKAIETINFVPIGNPLYDEMTDLRTERSDHPQYDVLLFGQSHSLGKWKPEQYEEYVRTIVDICESRDYRLAVKLHPHEDAIFYEDRGWGQYVIDENLQQATLRSRVTITDYSSAFLESVMLGSPAVLTQLMRDITDPTLADRIPGVFGTESREEIGNAIDAAVESYPVTVELLNQSGVFNLGYTAERIAAYVTAEADDRSSAEA